MIVTDGDLREALSGLGLAGFYCSQPEIFVLFEGWLRDKGYVLPGEEVSRDLLGRGWFRLARLLSEEAG